MLVAKATFQYLGVKKEVDFERKWAQKAGPKLKKENVFQT